MTIYEAKELNALMNFHLSDSEEIALEKYANEISHYKAFESFITDDASPVLENAIESAKSIIEKIQITFHKLVVRFGLIARSIIRRGQAAKLVKDMSSLGDINYIVMGSTLDTLKKAFKNAGIKDSWSKGVELYDDRSNYIITAPALKLNIKNLLYTATSIDRELESWLSNPTSDIDVKSLREKAKSCTTAINLIIRFLNMTVLNKSYDDAKKKHSGGNSK